MRFLKLLIAYYSYWTSEYADQTFLSLFIRVLVFIGVIVIFFADLFERDGDLIQAIPFLLGSVSLILTPYLQGILKSPNESKYSHLLDFLDEDLEVPMSEATKFTPKIVWIVLGCLCWSSVLVLRLLEV